MPSFAHARSWASSKKSLPAKGSSIIHIGHCKKCREVHPLSLPPTNNVTDRLSVDAGSRSKSMEWENGIGCHRRAGTYATPAPRALYAYSRHVDEYTAKLSPCYILTIRLISLICTSSNSSPRPPSYRTASTQSRRYSSASAVTKQQALFYGLNPDHRNLGELLRNGLVLFPWTQEFMHHCPNPSRHAKDLYPSLRTRWIRSN